MLCLIVGQDQEEGESGGGGAAGASGVSHWLHYAYFGLIFRGIVHLRAGQEQKIPQTDPISLTRPIQTPASLKIQHPLPQSNGPMFLVAILRVQASHIGKLSVCFQGQAALCA